MQAVELPPITVPNYLPMINLSFLAHGWLMIVIFLVFTIFYLIVSGVLFYHWSTYGMKTVSITIAQTLFLFVSVVLFCIAGLAIHYF